MISYDRPTFSPEAPQSIRIREGNYQMTIAYRWFTPSYVLNLILGGLVLGYFTYAFIESAAGRPLPSEEDGIFETTLGVLFIGLMGLYLTYAGLAGCLNTTIIEVDTREIRVRIKPLFWRGEKDIVRAVVKQFFVVSKERRYKGNATYTYEVQFRTYAGDTHKLIADLPNIEEAKFIRERMERYIGLESSKFEGALKE